MRIDVLQVDISGKDMFSDIKMIVHLNVFNPSVEDYVAGQVDIAHFVAIHENQISDRNVQIRHGSFQADGFTCGDNYAPILGFCARQCDCRVLIVAP